ncbi:transposase [Pararobbsia silviterrae]|nr:transposase [Pararobbsia silviterrae]
MKPYRVLTDEEWLAVAPLLPELQPRKETRGRPLTNTREVLNGVLWVMHSGSSWSMLPRRFPSYQTCHRRFKAWQRMGVLKRVLTQLFGPAGDEFHTAIVARMRNPQPTGAAARPQRAADPMTHAGGVAAADSVWSASVLHSAFAQLPSRAPLRNALHACESMSPFHAEASCGQAPMPAHAAMEIASRTSSDVCAEQDAHGDRHERHEAREVHGVEADSDVCGRCEGEGRPTAGAVHWGASQHAEMCACDDAAHARKDAPIGAPCAMGDIAHADTRDTQETMTAWHARPVSNHPADFDAIQAVSDALPER